MSNRPHTYTGEQHNFIKNNYKGISNRNLTNKFNKKFNLQHSEKQIKSYKSNRKWRSEFRSAPKKSIFSDAQREFIKRERFGISSKELTERLNLKFDTNFKTSQLRSFKSNHGLSSGYDTTFKKGQEPDNKGKTWDEYMSIKSQQGCLKTTFKKGQTPINHREVGSERLTKDGYVEIKTKEPSTWELKHRVIYEKEHGPIPEKHRLIFLDRDKENFSLGNLKLVSFGTSAVMSKQGLFFEDAEMTEAGSLIAEIKIKGNERRKERQKK